MASYARYPGTRRHTPGHTDRAAQPASCALVTGSADHIPILSKNPDDFAGSGPARFPSRRHGPAQITPLAPLPPVAAGALSAVVLVVAALGQALAWSRWPVIAAFVGVWVAWSWLTQRSARRFGIVRGTEPPAPRPRTVFWWISLAAYIAVACVSLSREWYGVSAALVQSSIAVRQGLEWRAWSRRSPG